MNTRENNTAWATYIAGAGTSWMIAGCLANPVMANPNIEIRTGYCNQDAYRAPAPQPKAESTPRPTGLFPTITYDDHGWGE